MLYYDFLWFSCCTCQALPQVSYGGWFAFSGDVFYPISSKSKPTHWHFSLPVHPGLAGESACCNKKGLERESVFGVWDSKPSLGRFCS